jgi:hypothetical protein
MVSMKVTDQNMVDTMEVGLKFHELHLRSFATINQEIAVLDLDKLRGGEPAIRRQRATGTQYGNIKTHVL